MQTVHLARAPLRLFLDQGTCTSAQRIPCLVRRDNRKNFLIVPWILRLSRCFHLNEQHLLHQSLVFTNPAVDKSTLLKTENAPKDLQSPCAERMIFVVVAGETMGSCDRKDGSICAPAAMPAQWSRTYATAQIAVNQPNHANLLPNYCNH